MRTEIGGGAALLAATVMALVYSDSIDVVPLVWALDLFAVALVLLLGFSCGAGRHTSCSAARCGSSRWSRASSRW
jgi:hypothetical protein